MFIKLIEWEKTIYYHILIKQLKQREIINICDSENPLKLCIF